MFWILCPLQLLSILLSVSASIHSLKGRRHTLNKEMSSTVYPKVSLLVGLKEVQTQVLSFYVTVIHWDQIERQIWGFKVLNPEDEIFRCWPADILFFWHLWPQMGCQLTVSKSTTFLDLRWYHKVVTANKFSLILKSFWYLHPHIT